VNGSAFEIDVIIIAKGLSTKFARTEGSANADRCQKRLIFCWCPLWTVLNYAVLIIQ